MKQFHDWIVQFTDWDSSQIPPASPTASLEGFHAHTQRSSHAFGDFRSRERLVQGAQGRLNSCVDHAVRHALAARPADLFFSPSSGPSNEDGQVVSWDKE